MTEGTLEETLVSHVSGLDLAAIPASTIENAKSIVLDTIGAVLSARGHESVTPVADLVSAWGGRPDARALGSSFKVPAHHAALINGTIARALELDDVHEPAMLHATATILPVALAAAERIGGVSGKHFLEAVIAGIDVSARLSLATLPAPAPRTMSLTYQTGILAGALTAARIAGLSGPDMRNVLGIAYSQCAGNQQALYEGVDTVRVQQGLSGMTAIISLELAMVGVKGVENALSGKAGWFSAFHAGRCNLDAPTGDLGLRFEIDNLSVKPFPCCKYTHTAIAAAIAARRNPRFDLDRIERVVAHVNSHECFKIVCEPQDFAELREALASPNGRVRAQFSLVHMVATALRHGNVEVHHLDADERNDAATLALTERIQAVIDPDKARDQLPVPGIIEIFLKDDNNPIRSVCTVPPGHPDHRMGFDRIVQKYAGVQALHWQGPNGDTPTELIRRLETVEDISELITALEEAV